MSIGNEDFKLAVETVKQCIKELNKESFYSKNLDNSSFKKFNLYMSLLSVIKYEKSFYKTQGEYTKKVVNKISDELLPTIKHVILPKANGLYLDCWDINPTNSGKYIF